MRLAPLALIVVVLLAGLQSPQPATAAGPAKPQAGQRGLTDEEIGLPKQAVPNWDDLPNTESSQFAPDKYLAGKGPPKTESAANIKFDDLLAATWRFEILNGMKIAERVFAAIALVALLAFLVWTGTGRGLMHAVNPKQRDY